MKTPALLLIALLAGGAAHAAVVAPPDGKDNPLTKPSEALPTLSEVPPPKDSAPTDAPPVEPAEPLPSDPSAAPEPAPILPKEAEFNDSAMVRIDVLMVSLPEEAALALLPQLRDPAQIAAAEQKILELIAKKEAALDGWPEVTTYSQHRAVSESIVEQRYPIEFGAPGANQSDEKPAPTGRAPSAAEKAVAQLQTAGMVIPETFETRNVGATLEVEPVISPDGTAVSMQIAPQLVRLERFMDFPAGTTARGDKVTVSQPIFTTSKISTHLTLRDGERRLLQFSKANEQKTRVELFIVGAVIIQPPQ